jgi:hypothetical protein
MIDFVPGAFTIPAPPLHPDLWLEQLTTAHNEPDLAAWSASHDQIHATPGFEGYDWPPVEPYTLEQNRGDLQEHEDDWASRTGFTYTVLHPADKAVLGCLYIYPSKDEAHDVHVKSWVRGDRPELDAVLWRLASDWLAADWPFERVLYAPR